MIRKGFDTESCSTKGNLTAIADTADSSYNRSLGYDAINRLTSVSGPWGSGTIAYNGTGNLTSQVFGSSSLTYTYDSQNRLASVAGSRSGSYNYEAYGAQGKLLAAYTPSQGKLIEYLYLGGKRIAQRETRP